MISIGLDVMCNFSFRGIHRTMDPVPSVLTDLCFQLFCCWYVEDCKSILRFQELNCLQQVRRLDRNENSKRSRSSGCHPHFLLKQLAKNVALLCQLALGLHHFLRPASSKMMLVFSVVLVN